MENGGFGEDIYFDELFCGWSVRPSRLWVGSLHRDILVDAERRIKFIITPLGSAGDVHPLVWLGRLLRDAGHEVVMIAQEVVADMPRRAGLRTVPYGDRAEQEKLIEHPHLWHPRKGFELLASWVPRWAREAMPVIRREIVPWETVMIGGALAFGSRVLSEAMDVPLLTVHLQPQVFLSVEESPVAAAGAEWMVKAPRWVRKGVMGLVHMQVDRKLKRPINGLRREAGPAGEDPVRGIMRYWWNSPDGVICLFPEWYARKVQDWPEQAVLTRFPLYDESDVRPASERLEAFLRAGEAPVVITPGSANVQSRRFIGESLAACAAIRKRAVVVTRQVDQLPRRLPAGVEAYDYLAFSRIFPRAAAVIHHGGIGTTAQCFAAGVPQLMMPMAHDQPDNAARVKRLGVGDYLYPRMFKWQRVAKVLKGMMGSEEVRTACEGVKRKVSEQMPPGAVTQIVNEIAERALRIRQINGPGVPC